MSAIITAIFSGVQIFRILTVTEKETNMQKYEPPHDKTNKIAGAPSKDWSACCALNG